MLIKYYPCCAMFCYDDDMKFRKTKNKKRDAILEITTAKESETRKLGALLAKTIIIPHPLQGGAKGGKANSNHALVISLEGDLGAGKTTFTKGFANGLGIREIIQSPTFVILKIYQITKHRVFSNFIHATAMTSY